MYKRRIMVLAKDTYTSVARFEDLQGKGCITAQPNGKTIVLFLYGEKVYALDNRCPHMGFPLDRGSVEDGILSCHWHHARFDLASGGAFDLWADDIDSFPVDVRDGEIYVDLRTKDNSVDSSAQSPARWLAAQPESGGGKGSHKPAEAERGAG